MPSRDRLGQRIDGSLVGAHDGHQTPHELLRGDGVFRVLREGASHGLLESGDDACTAVVVARAQDLFDSRAKLVRFQAAGG
jgi:hypothetical protein